MSAWWSKVGDEVKKHDGPRPLTAAMARLNAHVSMKGVSLDACALYRRDPMKNPTEPNALPALIARLR